MFDTIVGFGTAIKLIYDTIISILTIVTMGMIVAMYVVFEREARESHFTYS